MDWSIAKILIQDGVVTGVIYALMALALVLVFAVTRVIFIAQGEFVSFGALSFAMMASGQIPQTIYLLPIVGGVIFLKELYALLRGKQGLPLWQSALYFVLLPSAVMYLVPMILAQEPYLS